MGREGTRRGRRGRGTPTSLGYVRVVITIPCAVHTEHSAVLQGPYLKVRELVGLFTQAAGALGVWVLTEWTALDSETQLSFSEWTPELTGTNVHRCT